MCPEALCSGLNTLIVQPYRFPFFLSPYTSIPERIIIHIECLNTLIIDSDFVTFQRQFFYIDGFYYFKKTRKYGAHAMTVPKSSGSIQPMRGPLALSSTPLQQEAGGNAAVIILGVKLTGTGNGWGFPLVPVVFMPPPHPS